MFQYEIHPSCQSSVQVHTCLQGARGPDGCTQERAGATNTAGTADTNQAVAPKVTSLVLSHLAPCHDPCMRCDRQILHTNLLLLTLGYYLPGLD